MEGCEQCGERCEIIDLANRGNKQDQYISRCKCGIRQLEGGCNPILNLDLDLTPLLTEVDLSDLDQQR
jgi:hypothetical protein